MIGDGVLEAIGEELRKHADPERAESHMRFFRTGPGQYGEGDRFLGVRVPHIRSAVKAFRGLTPDHCGRLLGSPWHEERLFALLSMVDLFERGDEDPREAVYSLYMASTDRVNSWDLVDLSAPGIPGARLFHRDRSPLYELARNGHLWERRIAVVATHYFIRRNDFDDTLGISEVLLKDGHDLIHKAVGWMLREVGKRDLAAEESFLKIHCREMPRTMLRYAIERFPQERRLAYMEGRHSE
ncbi:MAG: DNA alkylation repair protein [Candidatus Aegiribacteria sp. MLS_C]|nr:MAG: DNA alkylation repair protein [Candidatus Aegiribacteria sp. MLS_C]